MAKFLIKQYETRILQYEVETADRGEAVSKVLNGEAGEGFETDFHEVNDDVGLSCDEINDEEWLLEELEAAGVELEEWGLPSISSVDPAS